MVLHLCMGHPVHENIDLENDCYYGCFILVDLYAINMSILISALGSNLNNLKSKPTSRENFVTLDIINLLLFYYQVHMAGSGQH
uniref:Uncharacterized protein n=1 Tax=Octopus bimaculoides TaxID=37653 RepID=A0A0L8IG52_OCTBM